MERSDFMDGWITIGAKLSTEKFEKCKKLLKYENLLLQLPWYEVYNTIQHKHLIRIISRALRDKKD